MQVDVRPMTAEDLDWVTAAEAEVEFTPWTRRNFEDSIAEGSPVRGHAHVLTVDGVPAGWAVMHPVLDELELLIIGVAKAWQRRGLGRRLLSNLIESARGTFVCVHLEVRASNAPARALYDALGFEEVGRRRNYYRTESGREDAILMRLDLVGSAGA